MTSLASLILLLIVHNFFHSHFSFTLPFVPFIFYSSLLHFVPPSLPPRFFYSLLLSLFFHSLSFF
ncbi:hypothetical protein RhiirB3_248755 [Rhizophagus irregularis]|nr:hypothetical protein RhiirB3_248755 [Rhizophagus irregularis]